MSNQYFTNACTVGHVYPVDYFHGMSSKTTAYLRNNTTLNVQLGLSKRISKTFFVALAKTYAGYCFAVNIYRVIKKMSPLAFKSNNSRTMLRTTLPDTTFERADNFISNECIHTRLPFQIASSQGVNEKAVRFLCVQISSNEKI